MKVPVAKTLRCAIYTRVSTEHGLDQEFNSLDNQREAAEAYIKSQAHEGWRCLPALYDDGGFSGGSIQRPGLQRLLDDIQARLLDIVVVYKVDRLTRSLVDFAKLVELFDAHDVSFVSVTQAFNTTNSMGRLTLNVLLSFAQFEREVTGERIRDKIAASKRKGIWMGGVLPLGYRVEARKLIVVEEEATTVRMIFERYLSTGSVPALQQSLRQDGITSRQRTLSSGQVIGGTPFTNGPLSYLLRNRMYLGEINHRDAAHKGEHAPIVDQSLFDAVQAKLAANQIGRRGPCRPSGALLLRKLFDDKGNRMTPVVGRRGPVQYRYYASSAATQGRHDQVGSVPRVSAPDIEAAVLKALRQSHQVHGLEIADDEELVRDALDRATLTAEFVDLRLKTVGGDFEDKRIAWSAPRNRQRRSVVNPQGEGRASTIDAAARARLLIAIVKARSWLEKLIDGDMESTKNIASLENCSERSVRMTLSLAFLSPKIIQSAIDGTLSNTAGIANLIDSPIIWSHVA